MHSDSLSSAHWLAIAGNPNSGKTSLFNKLTGLSQKVGNYPGVTVEKTSGHLHLEGGKTWKIVDIPGAYSLHATSPDERLVLQLLLDEQHPTYPELIVYVADINHLERHLLLFSQIYDLGLPLALCLTMGDLADDAQGIAAQQQKLSQMFQIPVFVVNGRSGEGLTALKAFLQDYTPAATPVFSKKTTFWQQIPPLAHTAQQLLQAPDDYHAWLELHHRTELPFLPLAQQKQLQTLCEQEHFDSLDWQVQETMQRFDKIERVVQKIATKKNIVTGSDKADAVLTHPVAGILIFLGVLFLIFQAIFSWAQYPMDWIEGSFEWINQTIKNKIPAHWLRDLLTDGILSGLSGILVFVPQIALLFAFLSLLEEIGYMARAVYLSDYFMRRFGMNGRSIVALMSGMACAVPAIMSTRTISNSKERLITILVTPFISCSARIPVYTMLIALIIPVEQKWAGFNVQGMVMFGLYLLGVVAALLASWLLKKIVKSRDFSYLALELPTYRLPQIGNVLINVFNKVKIFVWEAGKIILVISVILWVGTAYGPGNRMQEAAAEAEQIWNASSELKEKVDKEVYISSKSLEASYIGHLGKWIEPAIQPLGFDWKIGIALLTSFAAREVFVGTMATIYSVNYEDDDTLQLRQRLQNEKNPQSGEPFFTIPVCVSLLVFYVFALQCMSTIAVVYRETRSVFYPLAQFVFMSLVAYISAWIAYQYFS